MNNLPKKGDRDDKRCGLIGQQDIECDPSDLDDDFWCPGCEFHICDAHDQNTGGRIGRHDVMEHLGYEDED